MLACMQAFDEAATQEDVFCELKIVVHAALRGCNGSILAYGQTGAGMHPFYSVFPPRASMLCFQTSFNN